MFGRKESKETNGTYSSRSQRSCLVERDLKRDIARCEALIGHCDKKIRECEETKDAQLRHRIEGRGTEIFPLGATLTELEENKAERAAFEERKGLIQSQIELLINLSPQQAAERTDRQNHLAKVVAARLEKDRQVEGALKQLRQVLDQRADLSAKVTEAASAVELTVTGDGLDEERFKLLADLLPAELAATSERWHAWFTGDQKGMKSYAVVAADLVVPETLARAGSYVFGDQLELGDEEAGELGREICPLGRAQHDVSWSFEPARIMLLEKFEGLVREAADKGEAIQALLSRQNEQREGELLKQYEVEYQGAVREHRQAERAAGRLMGGNPADD